MSEWGEGGEGALTRRRKNRLLPSRGRRGSSILMWFLRGRLPNNSKLHRSQLEVLIKCLSEVEVERERAVGGKSETRLRLSRGQRDRRGRHEMLLRLRYCIVLQQSVCSATAVSETTPYWVTQTLPLCYTKHHAEQDWLPFPLLCYIWSLPIGGHQKWHMTAQLQ